MGIVLPVQGNVYLDANIFIYLLEGYIEFTSILQQLVDFIDSGNYRHLPVSFISRSISPTYQRQKF